VRFLVRTVAWTAAMIAAPLGLGAAFGQIGGLSGACAAVIATVWMWYVLPRAAHAAFEAGAHAAAARRFRLLGALAMTARRERAAMLSRIGCHVAANDLPEAERLLGAVAADSLDVAERTVWLNNRACITLAAGGDPHAALALIDEASALRPDVPAVQHTRGMALLAVGRLDEAIAVLDGMRAAGALPARLEAERCRELARAWTQKGETAYAEDYRMRAQLVS
jgi:predicted Zn-dependent protease